MGDIFGNCVSYTIAGDDSAVPVTKWATKAIDLNEESVKEDDHSKILKRNDQKGPIVVHLDNAVNIPGYYKPVLIKKSDSDETKCYRVYEEWLLAFCPQYRTLL